MNNDKEIVERVRRIETRVTKIGQHFNIDVGGGRPAWDPGQHRVLVPSPNCSLGEIIKAVPREVLASEDNEIDVYCGADYLTTLFHAP